MRLGLSLGLGQVVDQHDPCLVSFHRHHVPAAHPGLLLALDVTVAGPGSLSASNEVVFAEAEEEGWSSAFQRAAKSSRLWGA